MPLPFEEIFGSGHPRRKRFYDPRKKHYDSSLHAYLLELRTIPLLTAKDESALLLRASHGDAHAQQELIAANLRLVVAVALYFQGLAPMMDLISEGNLGLLEAMKRFDFSKSKRLSTYAKFHIYKRINQAVAEQGQWIRTPGRTVQKMERVQRVVSAFLNRGMEPTTKDIAKQVDLPVEQVVELLALLQVPLSLQGLQEQEGFLDETLEAPPLLLAQEGTKPSLFFADVVEMMSQVLSEQERQVLELRFGLSDGVVYDYDEIANKLYNRRGKRVDERIKQIERSALSKLRTAFDKEGEA